MVAGHNRRMDLSSDPDEESAEDDDEDAESDPAGGRRGRARPIESVGVEGPADPRLDMFRDFVNSLGVDPDASGESGGRSS